MFCFELDDPLNMAGSLMYMNSIDFFNLTERWSWCEGLGDVTINMSLGPVQTQVNVNRHNVIGFALP